MERAAVVEGGEVMRCEQMRYFPIVMAGLVPAIHVFLAAALSRRGCPGQARA
jgi:hypothetical protein